MGRPITSAQTEPLREGVNSKSVSALLKGAVAGKEKAKDGLKEKGKDGSPRKGFISQIGAMVPKNEETLGSVGGRSATAPAMKSTGQNGRIKLMCKDCLKAESRHLLPAKCQACNRLTVAAQYRELRTSSGKKLSPSGREVIEQLRRK